MNRSASSPFRRFGLPVRGRATLVAASSLLVVGALVAMGCGEDEVAPPPTEGSSSSGGTETGSSSGATTSGSSSGGGASSGGSGGTNSSGGSSGAATSSSGDAAVSSSSGGSALAACDYDFAALALKFEEIREGKPCDATCNQATHCCADLAGLAGGIGGSGGIPGFDAGIGFPTEVCLGND